MKNLISTVEFAYKNENDLVDYINWAINVGEVATKKVPIVAEQVATISKQVGKNLISIRTPNKTLHFDLQGATNKGVPLHISNNLY
ncbi:hypothetical protein [Sphingobacterium spiritivorum]|uniref:hypothetical protein n=1 Tax=Sphingobacterium spiritivorum TaxID=258 RepID=UPI001919A850|nr:hypothetical protein [Sphingobacterium spiritivorum]QQT24855.1 hypothetical protein I6J02_14075 [Sphingobacterium spiritivorum]